MKTDSTSAIVYFPGTNCEHDLQVAIPKLGGGTPSLISCKDREIPSHITRLFIPGGFSFGDYLRTGAMAKITPIMPAIRDFVEKKQGIVVGICNGFQILCEAGLLPGVLLPNRTTKFLSHPISLKVEDTSTPLTAHLKKGEVITVPIAHFEGNYFAEPDVIADIEENNQVLLRYCSIDGEVDSSSKEANPNGSIHSIAGIRNREGTVFGFMPHPERVLDMPLSTRFEQRGERLLQGLYAA